MNPRPYQISAIDALNQWMPENSGNPCIVLPTGSGKTPVMAWLIQQYVSIWPATRIIVLAHVRELLSQGVEKMRAIWPMAPLGIYSAGLNSREMRYGITYAGIQSVWSKACDFDPFDLIFVDEAHRIPLDGDAMYRKFIADARLANPRVRVVGFTATPYRMAGGPICGPDSILTDVVYEANVRDLIDDGYLCRLKSKGGDATIDTSQIHIRKGDFVTSELEAAAGNVIEQAVSEALGMMAGRKSALFFCITVAHAHAVSEALARHGFIAPVVSAKTPKDERAQLIRAFTDGKFPGLCNVNVLSEGFDAQRIDTVVMLRPTKSPGMYYQQVGRGLRIHSDKQDCLVLDFANNIIEHGPIDTVRPKKPKRDGHDVPGERAKRCPECKELCELDATVCAECGFEFPEKVREINHAGRASTAPILSDATPWQVPVVSVAVEKHEKPGKPPSIKVTYQGRFEQHREWICLQHGGHAEYKGRAWWKRVLKEPAPATVDEALGDLFARATLADRIKNRIEWVKVRQAGRYTEVIDLGIRDDHGINSISNAVRAFSA